MQYHTIQVDEIIMEHLKKHAEPFNDTPNSVLHRLLFKSTQTQPTTSLKMKSSGGKKRRNLVLEKTLKKSLGEILKSKLGSYELQGYSMLVFNTARVICKYSSYQVKQKRWFWGVSEANWKNWERNDFLSLIFENVKLGTYSFILLKPNEAARLFHYCSESNGDKKISMRVFSGENNPRIQEWKSLDITTRSQNLYINATDDSANLSVDKNSIKDTIANKFEILPKDLITDLKQSNTSVNPAFLAFLFVKYYATKGNFSRSKIVKFMDSFYLKNNLGELVNPWLNRPYRGKDGGIRNCEENIMRFRSPEQYGCWKGKNEKTNCEDKTCRYHPQNFDNATNCDFQKGVIWKCENEELPFSYGDNYVSIIKAEILNNDRFSLRPILNVFYPYDSYDKDLIEKFIFDFNLSDDELMLFSDDGKDLSQVMDIEPATLGRLYH